MLGVLTYVPFPGTSTQFSSLHKNTQKAHLALTYLKGRENISSVSALPAAVLSFTPSSTAES